MDTSWLKEWGPYLAGAVGAWVLLYALALGISTLVYRRLRLQAGSLRRADRAEFSDDARTALDALQPMLAALGFARVASCWGVSPVHTSPPLTCAHELYRHADGRAWALVSPSASGVPAIPGTVEWLTPFADGSCWLGLIGQAHQVLPSPTGWQHLDTSAPDLAGAWAKYAEHLAAHPAPVLDDADALIDQLNAVRAQTPERVCAQGIALPTAQGGARLTWRQSLRQAWRALRGQAAATRATALPAAQARLPATPEQARTRQSAETLAFELNQAVLLAAQQARMPRTTFWVTALLFIVVGGLAYGWALALMLLGVIALHEGGHWLAMRCLGYQRPSVFFVPGLGGAATGDKADATALQKVLVYLAGPMPGLVLALAGMALLGAAWPDAPGWVMQLLVVCLVVNAFNLLPLVPLDGGRVVEALLFARWPRLRLAFVLLCVAALAALAWLWRDPVLGVLAMMLGMALRWQWRMTRLEGAVRRTAQAPLAPQAAAQSVFAALQQPAFARWTLNQRLVAARNLVPALQAPPARLPQALVGLVLYAACLGLPLGAAVLNDAVGARTRHWVQALWAPVDAHFEEASKADQLAAIDAELARAQTLPEAERVDAWLEVAERLYSLDDDEPQGALAQRGQALLRQAWAVVGPRAPLDPQRAKVREALAARTDQAGEAIALRQQAVRELQGATGPVRLRLADALEGLVEQPPAGQTGAESLAMLQQAAQIRLDESGPQDYLLPYTRERLAQRLDAAGYPDAALAQLEANTQAGRVMMERMPARAGEWVEALSLVLPLTRQAWFLQDHGNADAARALAEQASGHLSAADRKEASWLLRDSLRVQLWAHIDRGDVDAVRRMLTELIALRAVEGGNGTRLSRDDALDQLAAAQLLRDSVLQQAAVTALAPRSPVGQCGPDDLCQARPRDDRRMDWQERARAGQRAAARAAGLCGVAASQAPRA